MLSLRRCWGRTARSAWLLLLAVTLAAHASPQGPPPEDAVAPPPADVQLKVETKDGQTTFHIGEVIPLVLSFTSSSPNTYQIDMASYDRSGRLGMETYAVEPKIGWDDPLKLYFNAAGGYIGGGLRGSDMLSGKPTVVRRELNEWVRFTRPGEYRIGVSSTRVYRIQRLQRPTPAIQGNAITITVVEATPEWQQETLERAVAALNAPHQVGKGAWDKRAEEKRREAMKQLRYLGTKTAGVELARQLNEPELGTDSELGIAGSPARQEIGAEMRTMLVDPDFPVSSRFITTISLASLPADPAGVSWQERVALETKYRTELASLLSFKRNEALAVSALSVIEEAAIRSRDLPPEVKKKASEALAANYDKLPLRAQANLLQIRWRALDPQTMLPLLRKVARRYEEFENPREMNAYESLWASAAALEHWYELEPAEARPAIIEEILRPKPRFNASVLGMLPDKELPEVSRPLAERLGETDDPHVTGNIASLIHRYADASVEPQVTAYLDDGLDKLACEVQDPLLAYLLKQDPAAARPQLEKSLTPRGDDRAWCYKTMFSNLGKLQNSPLLEELAIPALEHPEMEVVKDVAMYLKEHGSPAAEEPLLNRFAAWSKQWKEHEAELDAPTGAKWETLQISSAGWQLMEAVALGQGWLADQATLQRLIALSIGPRQRQEAERYLNVSETRPVRIQASGADTITLDIAQYGMLTLEAAKEKLKQYPRGTRFIWNGDGADADRVFADFSKIAAAAGLEILRSRQ